MPLERNHANAANTGRYEAAIGTQEWHTKWKALCPSGERPAFVLGHGFDAFLNAESAWLRFHRGQLVDRARRPTGDAEWDSSRELVYTSDHENHLTAVPTHAHAAPFTVPLVGGERARRMFLHREGDTLIAASVTPQMGGGLLATLETVSIAANSYQRRGLRIEPDVNGLHVAMHNEFLIAAFSDRVEILDLDLHLRRTLPAGAQPQGLSVDASGRIAMLCGFELRLLSITGECRVTPLPGSVPYFERPPLIGLDGTIYVLGPRRVVAAGETGVKAWEYETPDRIAGAAVTGDDRLLVAAGPRLLRLTNKGQVAVMQTFPGETHLVPPAFDAEENLYLVTNKNIHCLWRG